MCRERREKERQQLADLVGRNLTYASQLDGLDSQLYQVRPCVLRVQTTDHVSEVFGLTVLISQTDTYNSMQVSRGTAAQCYLSAAFLSCVPFTE